MIRKLLIANRGEIVSRIIRTCREMGIATVAVCSEADRESPYVRQADENVLIGPANPLRSYLNIAALIEAARETGADAVHPGYGFLSERGAFAEAVERAGLAWVGPDAKLLRAISSKCYCRQVADEVGVPVVPGTLAPATDEREIVAYGRRFGYPLFLKPDKGGGGKGIEVIESEAQVPEVFKRAASISQMAFGFPACYIERVVSKPRHIEVQFLADRQGNCVCLGERECSIQRRHQKIVEEAPSTIVTAEDRQEIFEHTRNFVLKLGYNGAGTIEGLRSQDGDYYFMEINARLQVEHPVTEFTTGIDIVKHQIRIAAGEPLALLQSDIRSRGSSIEARIYAEDPVTFLPSPGVIRRALLPEASRHLRIDHALEDNCVVPPYYDPLLAKVISWDATRSAAIGHLVAALSHIRIEGVKTNIATSLHILNHPRFAQGSFDTGFVQECLDETSNAELTSGGKTRWVS
jgi:acetyl-CoA carboxylase biotin carboxylase subunit